ncbi:acyltransferase [Flavobacterium caeni]|uniref:Transferase hexapeptide (Six repeat-containing protein) n=1 Tax=Flavobacterium caeni TaxID=490189 RepID=A0A1G5AX75_9FLAO|nr:acyltransferase [Flavobacterium caeni]SCX82434.1 transferase hexapeptide (six repeat-containing protein) [Flavobacterium caeni]
MKKRFKNNKQVLYVKTKIRSLKAKYRNPIRGNGNTVRNKGVLLNCTYDIKGDNNTVEIMPGAVLENMRIFMRGSNHTLRIGQRCHLKGGDFYFEDDRCTIQIGDNTTVESAHFAVTEPDRSITIGQDCMFSTGIEFRTGDSHSIIDNTTKLRINYAKDIHVKDHVWIGANAIILKGVTLGNDCIVGTGSLVTSDVPDNCIAAGIPAKVVKENINWLKKRIYDQGYTG